MSKKSYVDFHAVPDNQGEMHERLVNWIRWLRGGTKDWACHPMWKPCIRKEEEAARERGEVAQLKPVDPNDAFRIERAVAALPEKHRKAMRWQYYFKSNPVAACKIIAVSKEELARLVIDGRQMLINRDRLLAIGVSS